MTNNLGTAAPSPELPSDPSRLFTDHMTRIEALRPTNKAAILGALAAGGVTQVVVGFDGYGDSGQIEDVVARAGDAEAALPEVDVQLSAPAWGCDHVETRTKPLADAIEQFVYDTLADLHPGWENNDGACGTFTFDVAARTITLDHGDRYIAVETTTHVF